MVGDALEECGFIQRYTTTAVAILPANIDG